MTPNQTNSLLQQLKEKGDFSKPLKPQLAKLFVKAPWSDKVYSRHSWKGRAISWLRLPHEIKTGERKTCEIFAQILREHLQDKGVATVTSNEARRYVELLDEAPQKTSKKVPNPAFEQIKLRQEKKEEPIDPKVLFKDSYLLEAAPKSEPLDEKKLEALLCSKMDANFIEEVGKFLKEHPDLKEEGFEKRSAPLIKALQESQEWADKVKEARKKGEASLEHYLETTTRHLHAEITALSAASGETKKVCFSYGNPHPTIDTFLKRVERLPESMRKQIPQPLLDFLKSGELAHPEAYALKLLESRMPEKMPLERLWLLSPLLADPRRGLPSWLERRLPALIKNFCNERLQEGPLVNVARLIPFNSLSAPLSLAGHFGNYLIEKKVIQAQVSHTLKNLLGLTDNSVENMAATLKNSVAKLPFAAQSMLGFNQGPLWLEFERAADNTFNLAIYSNGEALAFHPQDPAHHKPYLVRRLKGIQEGKLTEEFISLLLRQTLEPYWNDEAESSSEEFYKTVLPRLEGVAAAPLANERLGDPSDESTPCKLAERILFDPESETVFSMKWEAYLKACRSYQPSAGSPLKFKKPEEAQKLEGYTLLMEEEVKGLKDSTEKKRIETTLQHIRHELKALKKEDKKEGLGASFIAQLQKEAAEKGLNRETIESISSTLSWALSGLLGQEMGERVEPLWNDLTSELRKNLSDAPPPVANTQLFPALHALKEGWLRDWAAGNWRQLSWQVFQLSLVATSIYTGGISYSLPVLWAHLPKFLPAPVASALLRLELAVLSLSVEFMLYVARALFLDQETREGWLRSIQNAHQKITGPSQPLSFTLTEPVPKLASSASHDSSNDPSIALQLWEGDEATYELQPASPHSLFGYHIPGTIPKTGLSDSELMGSLNEWLTTAGQIAPHDPANPAQTLTTPQVQGIAASRSALFYLLRQIERLDIPSSSKPTQWDRVEKPGECLKVISKLCDQVRVHQSRSYLKDSIEANFAQHHLLAISYHLFKREAKLSSEDFTLNIYKFVHFIRTCTDVNKDPRLFARAEAICHYLAPGIDLNRSLESCKKPVDQDLKYFKDRPGLLPEHIYFHFHESPHLYPHHDYSFLTLKRGQINFSFLSSADEKLLSPLLSSPVLANLKESEKKLYLFLISFLKNSDYPLSDQLANYAQMKSWYAYEVQDPIKKLIDEVFDLDAEKKLHRKEDPNRRNKYFGLIHSSQKDDHFICSFETLIQHFNLFTKNNRPPPPDFSLKDQRLLLNDPNTLVTQPNCLEPSNSSIKCFDTLTLDEKDLLLLLTRCAQESRIILTLNYFKENSVKWEKAIIERKSRNWSLVDLSLIKLLDSTLFSPRALTDRLQESPQFAQTLGELFSDLMGVTRDKNLRHLGLIFAYIGIDVAKACDGLIH